MYGITRVLLSFTVALFLAVLWSSGVALADKDCNKYCSGPGKSYDSCMKECIGRKQDYGGHRVGRDIESLCSSRGHDYDSCMREQYDRGRDRRQPYSPYGGGY